MGITYKRCRRWFPCQIIKLCAILVYLSLGTSFGLVPAEVPALDDMAGDWLPDTAVANPPAVHNFHDMLQVNRDLTSFNFYPWRSIKL
jgi:hypothetical protein